MPCGITRSPFQVNGAHYITSAKINASKILNIFLTFISLLIFKGFYTSIVSAWKLSPADFFPLSLSLGHWDKDTFFCPCPCPFLGHAKGKNRDKGTGQHTTPRRGGYCPCPCPISLLSVRRTRDNKLLSLVPVSLSSCGAVVHCCRLSLSGSSHVLMFQCSGGPLSLVCFPLSA